MLGALFDVSKRRLVDILGLQRDVVLRQNINEQLVRLLPSNIATPTKVCSLTVQRSNQDRATGRGVGAVTLQLITYSVIENGCASPPLANFPYLYVRGVSPSAGILASGRLGQWSCAYPTK